MVRFRLPKGSFDILFGKCLLTTLRFKTSWYYWQVIVAIKLIGLKSIALDLFLIG